MLAMSLIEFTVNKHMKRTNHLILLLGDMNSLEA